MKQVRLDLPELGMIIATRAMLGAGIALLLADRFTRDQGRAVGATLTIIGLVTTIPAIWTVCGNAEKKSKCTSCVNATAKVTRRLDESV